jgi:hypothetical protein
MKITILRYWMKLNSKTSVSQSAGMTQSAMVWMLIFTRHLLGSAIFLLATWYWRENKMNNFLIICMPRVGLENVAQPVPKTRNTYTQETVAALA